MNRRTFDVSDAVRGRMLADLPALRRVVERRGRRSRLVRGVVAASAACGAILIAIGVWRLPSVAIAPGGGAPHHPARAALEHVETIGTDPAIVSTVAFAGPAITQQIGDDELRAALAQAGRPDGTIRVGPRVRLNGESWDADPDARGTPSRDAIGPPTPP